MVNRVWGFVVLMLCLCAPAARGDAIDEAEAKRRGVSVEVVQLERAQQQIADLKKENTELRDQIKKLQQAVVQLQGTDPVSATATTAPASPGTAVIAKLNTMPKEIWPMQGETEARRELRQKWLASAFAKGEIVTGISGNVANASTVNGGGRGGGTVGRGGDQKIKEIQQVYIVCGNATLWGRPCQVSAEATLDNVTSMQAAQWTKDTVIELSGPLVSVSVSGNDVGITMGLSHAK